VLGGLMSKVFTHGIGSGKFGLSGSAVGMLGAMIGLESITGAYSAGSPIGGLLGGAAGGALTGFAIGGPLGAAIGGIIGGIAGLFGGIFGKRKKEHQAWDLVLQKYVPAIQQVVDDYANFQMQFQDAMSQLDQLQNQAKQDLHGLGGTGDKISPKAFPGVSTMRAKGSRAGRTIARGAAPSTSACRCSMRGVTWATARTCWPCCATVRL
jgi:hypothetical protein